jgi:hypothetical protein
MMHVTNGQSVLAGFRDGGLPGAFLAWNDVLHDGPVPRTSSLPALSDIRASALASFGRTSEADVRAEFAARDGALASYSDHDEVVLWFEHDLYDQLQLMQLLAWFDGRDLRRTRLSLIQIDRHPEVVPFYGLGQLNGRQLAELLPSRTAVTPAQLAAGRDAWDAFCAPDPAALVDASQRDAPGLPFLRPALHRFLQEYPSTGNGLSRLQHEVLAAAAHGARTPRELYAASREKEPWPWGDASVFLRIDWLASPPAPALSRGDDSRLTITRLGERLLKGDADWIRERGGIDTWLGGVHLTGADARWRWSEAQQMLVSADSAG